MEKYKSLFKENKKYITNYGVDDYKNFGIYDETDEDDSGEQVLDSIDKNFKIPIGVDYQFVYFNNKGIHSSSFKNEKDLLDFFKEFIGSEDDETMKSLISYANESEADKSSSYKVVILKNGKLLSK